MSALNMPIYSNVVCAMAMFTLRVPNTVLSYHYNSLSLEQHHFLSLAILCPYYYIRFKPVTQYIN